MNKSQNRWTKKATTLCAEISAEDGIAPRFLLEKTVRKKMSVKELQLGKEAARILSLVLAGEVHNQLLQNLVVVSVLPESQGQLCITVGYYDPTLDATQVMTALHKVQGLLRTALAQSIHRKRVPLLTFHCVELFSQETI